MAEENINIRRDDILSAVGYATSGLLRSVDWKSALDDVLEKLGKASNANRAYFFLNHIRSDGTIAMSQLAEWAAPGIEPEIDNPDLQDLPYVESGFQRWAERMNQREPVHGLVCDFPEAERQILEPQGIRSIIAMPVFSRDRWAGFIGFDDCESQRTWSQAEFDALLASTEALGAAIERQQLEQELRFAQKLEAIGKLASGVAHDFNNVLQVLVGLADVAKMEIDSKEAVSTILDEIVSIGTCTGSLAHQLLAFSRKQNPAPKIIDLDSIMDTVAIMLKTVGNGTVELNVTVSDPVPKILADVGLYTQVILNLCLNACDAMPDGGTLEIVCETVTLGENEGADYPDPPPGQYACCSVRDTGFGMDAEMCKRVFEPFYTTKEVGKGTGLGLSVSQKTIRECGGFIHVESRLEVGTCFRVFVPLAEEPASEADASLSSLSPGAGTILLIEDEPLFLKTMRQSLEAAGYTVRAAKNGSQGVAMFERHADSIDLVITDFQLPQMTGMSVAQAIKASRPHTKVIILSGAFDEDVPADCLFLPKPISMRLLQEEIHRLLAAPGP